MNTIDRNFEQNEFSNGIYTVIVGNASVDVYCDMVTYNGGWTLFQRFENSLGSESRFQNLVE